MLDSSLHGSPEFDEFLEVSWRRAKAQFEIQGVGLFDKGMDQVDGLAGGAITFNEVADDGYFWALLRDTLYHTAVEVGEGQQVWREDVVLR